MPQSPEQPVLRFGDFVFDVTDQRLTGPQGQVKIGNKAFQVLGALVRLDGRLLTKDELFETVWDGMAVSESALTSVIKELRRALGDDTHQPRYIESVYGRGYRFLADVTTMEAMSKSSLAAPSKPAFPAASPARRKVLGMVAAVAVMSAAIGGSWWYLGGAAAGHKRVLVEALRAEPGDVAAVQLRKSLSSDLTRMTLGSDTALRIVDGADQPAKPAAADFVVTGEAASDVTALGATVRLVDAADGTILWSREFSGPPGKIDALRQQIAMTIADVLTCAFGSRSARPANLDLATLRLFLAGCENIHTDWPAARRYLGQVVERKPDFAQARAMYAAALFWNTGTYSGLPKAEWAALRQEAEAQARKAVDQDPKLGLAYYVIATARKGQSTYAEREAILRKGQLADPHSGEISLKLCVELSNIGMTREAVAQCETAARLSPFLAINAANLAENHAFAGRLPDALREIDAAGKIWPNEFYTSVVRFEIAARRQDPAKALAMLETAVKSSPLPSGSVPLDRLAQDQIYVPEFADQWREFLKARNDPAPAATELAARAMLAEAPQLVPRGQILVIQHLVQLGRIDDAYALASKLEPVSGEWGFVWFRDYMAPFRADPRFLPLLARQQITATWAALGRSPDFCVESGLRYRCPAGPSEWRAIKP